MKERVMSGSRVMTILQAIEDEIYGGDFLASMSDHEYFVFTTKLSIHYN
jgi:hypothetical protein